MKKKSSKPKAKANSAINLLASKLNAQVTLDYETFKSALEDFADYGVRADLTPTSPVLGTSEEAKKIHRFYQDYLSRVDRAVWERAAVALGRTTWRVL